MNARRARAATALRFLMRSLTLRGAPFLLALLAVTTAATVTATMLNLEADLGPEVQRLDVREPAAQVPQGGSRSGPSRPAARVHRRRDSWKPLAQETRSPGGST